MKNLTSKELIVLGVMGDYLKNNPELHEIIRRLLVNKGYESQMIEFADKTESRTDAEDFIYSLIVEVILDVIRENDVV